MRKVLGIVACLVSFPAMAQPASTEHPTIQSYAATQNISYGEAQSRLARLNDIVAVEKALNDKFPNQFGGLYVVHSPSFKVVVKMTGGGQGLLKQITSDPLFVVEKAETPINQLNQLKDKVARKVAAVDSFQFSAEVNVFDGTVDIRSQDNARMQSLLTDDLQQNKNIRLIQVETVSSNTATIYGGRQLTGTQTCTSGFNVKHNGVDAIITSGHCDDTMTLSGVSFNLVERVYKYSDQWGFDMQVMRTSGTHSYPNQTYTAPSTLMTVTGVADILNYPIDWPICVYGSVTNTRRCGKIKAKFLVLKDNRGVTNAVHRAASDDGKAFNQGGDSGGPVVVTNTAVGLIKAKGAAVADLYFVDFGALNGVLGSFASPVSIKTAP
ncbi:MAG: S1 family peptidase [Sphingobium sp.]|jgi:hypothetical protein|nr:S1 family peptidase [Sphingobium sp.]MCI1270276.1 S1 family peptidase [Sphingobium sp.]MCI1754543.1 S1 family peptidase [Sphingobium sp.]MCI2051982.1 S1 family peptidase [Sphingobium sp.]